MKSILVIDDDESVRSLLKIKFSSTYKILEADNGKTGLAAFIKHKPDLIITDIIMPEEEGFKTIMDIREINKNVPILAITGMGYIGGLDSLGIAKEFGANVGMLKPLNMNKLEDSVNELLANG